MLKICANPKCEKEFNSCRNRKKFCSYDCYKQQSINRFTSENNPGFKKGNIPWNKGKKTTYHIASSLPIGTIVTRKGKGKNDRDGRKYIKNEQGKWALYDIYVWVMNNGPIPKGYVINHRNGSMEDCSISNLELKKSGVEGRKYKANCRNCSESFILKELTQKFCCLECFKQHQYKKSHKNCKNCQNEFYGRGKRKFCSVKCCAEYKTNNDLHKGFKKGNVPWNKGKKGYIPEGFKKHMFKKGNIPSRRAEIGTIVLRKRIKQKYPYRYIKVAHPSEWIRYDKYVWEQHNGKIPDGYVVYHKDGEQLNDDISNLATTSMKEFHKINLTRGLEKKKKSTKVKRRETQNA